MIYLVISIWKMIQMVTLDKSIIGMSLILFHVLLTALFQNSILFLLCLNPYGSKMYYNEIL